MKLLPTSHLPAGRGLEQATRPSLMSREGIVQLPHPSGPHGRQQAVTGPGSDHLRAQGLAAHAIETRVESGKIWGDTINNRPFTSQQWSSQ